MLISTHNTRRNSSRPHLSGDGGLSLPDVKVRSLPEGFADNWTVIAIAGAVGLIAIGGLFLVSHVLAPSRRSGRGRIPYECGIEATPFSWSRTNIRYYVFGLAFLIFDVEAVFLFPWAVTFLKASEAVFYEMIIFLGILMFGLTYAWRKGALSWK